MKFWIVSAWVVLVAVGALEAGVLKVIRNLIPFHVFLILF